MPLVLPGAAVPRTPLPCPGSPTAPPTPGILDIRWEECACPLCGGRNAAPLVRAPDFDPEDTGLWFTVVRCLDCGLCFTNPRPDRASMARFYPADYRPHRLPETGAPAGPGALPGRREAPASAPGRGRLLDFGCGGGKFLRRVHR